MLIDFTIRNFMSYRDEVSLSMMASATVKECESNEDSSNVIVVGNGKRVLKTAAIYGANGSGKSNIIEAMNFFEMMILRSVADESIVKNLSRLYYHFDTESAQLPISMQMIFVCEKVRYRYGFEVMGNKVLNEWLFLLMPDSSKESYCIKREGKNIKINTKLIKGARGVDTKTRENALYLSTAAQFNVAIAMVIKEWFSKRFNVLSGMDNTMAYTVRAFMHDSLIHNEILRMISIVDNCIKDVQIEENVEEVDTQNTPAEDLLRMGIYVPADKNKKIQRHEVDIRTTHAVYQGGEVVGNKSLNFQLESWGTTKLFAMLGPFFDTIYNGGVLIIDEFGASLHTQLSVELLRLFYSKINTSGAQLIITTHDTNLLRNDLLRRDQIWFAEKSSEGVSDLYSLVEYKINQANSVRNDASYSKDYLLGRYGAIPYFGNLEKFILEYGTQEKHI